MVQKKMSVCKHHINFHQGHDILHNFLNTLHINFVVGLHNILLGKQWNRMHLKNTILNCKQYTRNFQNQSNVYKVLHNYGIYVQLNIQTNLFHNLINIHYFLKIFVLHSLNTLLLKAQNKFCKFNHNYHMS
jgi:hypothetical protein